MLVGPYGTEHTVHKDLLCNKSPFFSAAVNDHWKEGQEGRVPLPNDDPAVFALYIQWIYRGRIFSRQDMGDTGGNQQEIKLLVDAFVLGEKLQDQDFKDAVIDSLVYAVDTPDEQDKKWYPTPSAVDSAYRGTPESSPLRRLMVDMHFFHGHPEWLDETYNTEFLRDVARLFLQDRSDYVTRADRTTAQVAGCTYHCHEAESACYKSWL